MSDKDLRRADDIQIGMLIQSVNTLTTEVNNLRTIVANLSTAVQASLALVAEVSTLRKDVADLKAKESIGKGFLLGLTVAAGGAGAGLAQLLGKVFHQ